MSEIGCHFANLLSFVSSSFFLSLRKITWLNLQQPKTRRHVEHLWQVKPGSWLERGDKRNRQSAFWSALWFLKIKVLRNQSLFQTLEKFQVLQTLIVFRSPPWKKAPEKKLGLYYKPEKIPGGTPEKKSRFAEPEIFLGFEKDIDFSRPWFSEIRVQIKCRVQCIGLKTCTKWPKSLWNHIWILAHCCNSPLIHSLLHNRIRNIVYKFACLLRFRCSFQMFFALYY